MGKQSAVRARICMRIRGRVPANTRMDACVRSGGICGGFIFTHHLHGRPGRDSVTNTRSRTTCSTGPSGRMKGTADESRSSHRTRYKDRSKLARLTYLAALWRVGDEQLYKIVEQTVEPVHIRY